MIPRMRTIGLVFAGAVAFMSCLAATGCGDVREYHDPDLIPRREGCAMIAEEVCGRAFECGSLQDVPGCMTAVKGFCCDRRDGSCVDEPLDWPVCEADLDEITCDNLDGDFTWHAILASCF